MRPWVALALLLLALAGCALPEDEQPDPLLGVCPQWDEGPWTAEASILLDGDTTTREVVHLPKDNGTELLEWQGFPLDAYRFRFDHLEIRNATLELRAYADESGQQRGILDYRDPGRPQQVPVLTLGPASDVEEQEFDVFLTPVAHGSEPVPTGLRLAWRLEPQGPSAFANATLMLGAGYRVCGAPLPSG